MSSVCRECRDDLEHCHGTVIHHALSRPECTEDCGAPEAMHVFSIDCGAIGCVCTVVTSASAVS